MREGVNEKTEEKSLSPEGRGQGEGAFFSKSFSRRKTPPHMEKQWLSQLRLSHCFFLSFPKGRGEKGGTTMIIIDGSQGEGGGQVLRSALSLSAATGKPFVIDKIRANRSRPGLARQHLTAVKAAAEICAARVEGAEVNSTRLTFEPGALRGGDFAFNIGTAGSTMLVLQTVAPALALASGPSTLTIMGGTHNPNAPVFEFVDRAFFPLLRRMGFDLSARLARPGFYPVGGGEIRVWINPAAALSPLDLEQRGELKSGRAEAVVAKLPGHIAERELAEVAARLGWEKDRLFARTEKRAAGPGNYVLITLIHEHVTEVFTSIGRRGAPGEMVAGEAAAEAIAYLENGAPVGPHLADQLLLPMALGAGGRFVTAEPSSHTLTNMDIIEKFLDVPLDAIRTETGTWLVTVGE
jgi:RNA 3'-terminal phosphate cyclase (ATP)